MNDVSEYIPASNYITKKKGTKLKVVNVCEVNIINIKLGDEKLLTVLLLSTMS